MSSGPTSDELLTVGDAAHHAHCSLSTIRLWIERGKLPMLRTRGGVRLIRLSDLDRLLADRAKRPRGFSAGGRLLELSRDAG